MKANAKLLRKLTSKDDEAVSPVIAVILMVAITVVLAATVYVWVSGFSGNNQKVMNAQLSVTGGDNQLTVKHVSGDAVAASSWKISITSTTAATDFCTIASALSSGAQLVYTKDTGNCVTDTNTGNPNGTDLAAGDYKVVVVETTTNTVLFDRTVTVT